MEPERPRRQITPLGIALVAAPMILASPFLLLAIALLDDHVLHTRVPYKVYNALGIWEPLEGLYFMLFT